MPCKLNIQVKGISKIMATYNHTTDAAKLLIGLSHFYSQVVFCLGLCFTGAC